MKEEAKAIVDLAYKFAEAANHQDRIKFAEERGVETMWKVEQKKKLEDVDPKTKIA